MATTRRPVRRPRQDPYLTQALNEAEVRYGPERYALGQLVQDAVDELKSRQRIARETALGVQAVIKSVQADVIKAYQGFDLSRQQSEAQLRADLGTITSPQADRYKAPAYTEMADARTRMAEGLKTALASFGERRIGAVAGQAYDNRQSQAGFEDALGKVRGRQTALAGEVGSYVASRSYQMGQDKQKADLAAQKERDRIRRQDAAAARSAAAAQGYVIDPATGQRSRSLSGQRFDYERTKPKSGSGRGSSRNTLTLGQKNTFLAPIENAASEIRRLHQLQPHIPWHALADIVTGTAVPKDAQGKPVYHGPKFSSQVARAGMEVAAYTGLTKPTQRWLVSHGVKVPVVWRHPEVPRAIQQINTAITTIGTTRLRG